MPVLECSRCNELYYSAHGSTELSCDACGGGAWRVFEDEVSLARVAGLPRVSQPGDHGVLVYTEERDAAQFCVRYLEEGRARGERLIVALPEGLSGKVVGRLAPAAMKNAIVLESEQLYGGDFDPEATAQEFGLMVKQAGGPARIVSGLGGEAAAEIDPDTFRRYERIAHQLLLDLDTTALCVYDSRRLPMAFSSVAVEGHPLISRNGTELRRNGDFRYESA